MSYSNAFKIAAAVATVAVVGYAGYKAYDHYSRREERAKRQQEIKELREWLLVNHFSLSIYFDIIMGMSGIAQKYPVYDRLTTALSNQFAGMSIQDLRAMKEEVSELMAQLNIKPA